MFRERARCIVAAIAKAEAEAAHAVDTARGRLRVSAPPEIGRRRLAGLIATFAEAHPGINLHATHATRTHVPPRVRLSGRTGPHGPPLRRSIILIGEDNEDMIAERHVNHPVADRVHPSGDVEADLPRQVAGCPGSLDDRAKGNRAVLQDPVDGIDRDRAVADQDLARTGRRHADWPDASGRPVAGCQAAKAWPIIIIPFRVKRQ